MSVGRDHAPTQHVGSVRQRWNRDGEACIHGGNFTERNSIAARTYETDRERRNRFIEGEPQRRWRLRDDGTIGGLGLHQCGVRPGDGRRHE